MPENHASYQYLYDTKTQVKNSTAQSNLLNNVCIEDDSVGVGGEVALLTEVP